MDIEKKEAIKSLKKLIKPGDTIYANMKHVSSSGMLRAISFYAIKGNKPHWLDYQIAKACGMRFSDKYEAILVSGCGMDMAFHVVYQIGSVLWPKGNGKYITGRNGDTTPETDGGYLLKKSNI